METDLESLSNQRRFTEHISPNAAAIIEIEEAFLKERIQYILEMKKMVVKIPIMKGEFRPT